MANPVCRLDLAISSALISFSECEIEAIVTARVMRYY